MNEPKAGARWALGLLLAVNLFHYLDRQVLYSLLPLIQGDLRINDAQAGRLASAFMIVYMLAAPPIGYWASRSSRPPWLAAGIAMWSLATAASGLARRYATLFCARAAVGIGESCFGTISPSFVAEHYPPERRSWVLSLFYLAIPVGSALGYVIGGTVGEAWGWRRAFFVAGIPGLVLAALAARLRDPNPGAGRGEPRAPLAEYLELFRIRSFTRSALAGAAMTFTLGGLAVWMPSFFHRAWGLGVGRAGTLFGAVTVVSGVAGSLLGGWLADRLQERTSKAALLVSGVGLLAGLPVCAATLYAPTLRSAIALLFCAESLLFLNMGPLNAVIVAVTRREKRSMAFAANILVIHVLGDAFSPALIGAASDRWGLRPALLGSCSMLAAAGALCFASMRTYDADAAAAAR